MDKNPLLAIELFGFMALAVWLVYYQFVSSRRGRGEPDSDKGARRDEDGPSASG
jgi:hypothetical protein